MFGLNDDQDQNPSKPPAAGVPTPAAPNITSTPPVAASTTPPGIGSVNMEDAYITPPAQIGPAKASEPQATPPAASMIPNSPAATDALTQIRQQAIQSLEPLVEHLQQTPEEKFKTLMMLIQASDNSKLLNEAYEEANKITDEKTRAQALLDIVNEVNYFNHQAVNKPS